MGLLSKIKSVFKRTKTPLIDAGEEYQQNITEIDYIESPVQLMDIDGNNSIMLNSIKYNNQYVYQDGRKTNIMIAQILNKTDMDEEYGLFRGERDYIAFEMPEGTKVNDDVLIQKIATYYSYGQQQNMFGDTECKYIGFIDQNANNNEIRINPQIDKYVREEISENIKNNKKREEKLRKEFIEENSEKNISASKRYRDNLQKETMHSMNIYKKQAQDRIENFYLQQTSLNRTEDGKRTTTLEGIDLTNGDFLKIYELDKVGKDTNGTYVYTAYLEENSEKGHAQVLDRNGEFHSKASIPVCFTTQKRIEDIVEGQDRQELYNVLSLLSNKDVLKENNGYLNFIGSLDEKTNIQPKGQENLSNAIRQKIYSLQSEFYQKERQSNEQNYSFGE